VSEEAYDETLSRLKMKEGGDAAAWGVEKQRTIRAEYVLTRAPGAAGWLPLRDVFEVDGRKVRDRDDRLLQLVDQGPAGYDKATRLSDESARYDIAFVDRNANLPTLALQFLDPANAGRFVFIKQGEEVVDGVPTWQVAFAERGSPTFIQGQSRDLPADGVFWIDPTQGRVVRSTLRLKVEPTDSEITVTYRPAEGLGDRWVPAEMRESHTASTIRLECVARFTKVRVKG